MPAIVIPDVALNDGTTIPQLGFGVFRVPDHEATPAVAAALWRALEKIKDDGLTRSIGVANFPPAQLERLFAKTGTVPAVNQIELHPRLPQAELREFNARHGIATQAWSPLGHGQLISDLTVATLAERRGKTAAQILLRWNLELGNAVISKSVTPERIRTNMEIFDFELASEDHTALATLNTRTRTGPDPEVYGACTPLHTPTPRVVHGSGGSPSLRPQVRRRGNWPSWP